MSDEQASATRQRNRVIPPKPPPPPREPLAPGSKPAALVILVALVLAVALPGLVVSPTADDPAPGAVLLAMGLTLLGVAVAVVTGVVMKARTGRTTWLVLAFVPSVAVITLGVLLTALLLAPSA